MNFGSTRSSWTCRPRSCARRATSSRTRCAARPSATAACRWAACASNRGCSCWSSMRPRRACSAWIVHRPWACRWAASSPATRCSGFARPSRGSVSGRGALPARRCWRHATPRHAPQRTVTAQLAPDPLAPGFQLVLADERDEAPRRPERAPAHRPGTRPAPGCEVGSGRPRGSRCREPQETHVMPYRPSPVPRPPKDASDCPPAADRADVATAAPPGTPAPVAMLRRFRRGRWTLTPV